MPWSNQGGGPWGTGGGGGKGPQQSGPTSPDLEEFLRRSQDKLRNVLPGGNLGGKGLALIVLAAIAIWGLSGFFRVEPDELGVVLRFGKYVRDVKPGLNYHLPYPIESALTPKVTRVNRIDIGIRNVEDLRRGTTTREVPEESAMREIIGRSELEPILARQNIEAPVHDLMQSTLDRYGAGIQITQVQLQKVDAPSQVIDAFRDVQAARIDQERAKNEAETYANKVVPE